MLTKQSKKVLL